MESLCSLGLFVDAFLITMIFVSAGMRLRGSILVRVPVFCSLMLAALRRKIVRVMRLLVGVLLPLYIGREVWIMMALGVIAALVVIDGRLMSPAEEGYDGVL